MLTLVLALATATLSTPLGNEWEARVLPSESIELGLLAPPSSTAPAEEGQSDSHFSYTFIEVGAAQYDVDQIDETSDIYYGRASIGLFGFLYAFGEYQNQSLDFSNTDTDLITLGAGAHISVMRHLDLFGEIGWLYSDVSSDLAQLDDTTNGYEVFGGARWMILPSFLDGLELNGGLGYVDLDNGVTSDSTTTQWSAGARLHFLKFMSVGAEYAILGDDDQVSANVRFSF